MNVRPSLAALLLVGLLGGLRLGSVAADDGAAQKAAATARAGRDTCVRAWLRAPLAEQGARERAVREGGVSMIHALRRVAAGAPPANARRAERLAATLLEAWHRTQTPKGMIYIPAGSLELPRASAPFGPRGERVHVAAFYIDRTEVTHAAWRAWAGGVPDLPRGAGGRLMRGPLRASDAQLPIASVRWDEAKRFAREARGARLPRLLEWQRAARGSSTRKWPWGSQAPEGRANFSGLGPGEAVPVASYAMGVSPFGVHDMLGNVAEWLETRHQVGRNKRHLVPDVSGGSFRDRADPRVHWFMRGGHRRVDSALARFAWLGFRCARSVPELPPES